MKSEMPYLGVYSQPMRSVCAEVFAAYPLASFAEWRQTIISLWQ